MHIMRVGSSSYAINSQPWDALAHVLGAAFIELQQLEFTIISYLADLSNTDGSLQNGFDLFASKTFGNLLRALEKHEYLKPLATKMASVKDRRDFFVHRFLFDRYGGPLTTDEDYEALVRDAIGLRELFAETHEYFHDFMFDRAPLVMFSAKRHPNTGEYQFVESKFSTSRRK